MEIRISPAQALRGAVRLPGDKSISHRYAILGALADGTTRIRNFATGADCASTLGVLRALGLTVRREGNDVEIEGRGLEGLRAPQQELDAGNSGSTMRMLAGVLAAQPFRSCIRGDASLSRRPMNRIIEPLARMGALIRARDGKFPPLEIDGRPLRPIEYELPVASAQVKSCVLLAGLFADGETTVIEPVRTRDHTEIALREFGADVKSSNRRLTVRGRPRLAAQELTVPGDISSAAFFLVAATLVAGSSVVIEDVGLNPTRAALLDFLVAMGARIRVLDVRQAHGELRGALHVEASHVRGGVIESPLTAALIDEIPVLGVRGGVIESPLTAALIDEIPVLGVLGAASAEGLAVRDAAELRIKESDRIATLAENLRRMGVAIHETQDGFEIPGRQKFHGAELDSFGDHRIAMALAVAALAAGGESVIKNAEAAAVSFPEFFANLRLLTGSE